MFQVKDGDSIVLASESTRRVDILRSLGISFSIIPPDVDETNTKMKRIGSSLSVFLMKRQVRWETFS